jgi:CBS domain-containing protein
VRQPAGADAEYSSHRFNGTMTRRKEGTMRVSEAMTPNVQIASPGQTIREAAKMMAEIDAGALPVGDNDRLVGVITDRDIAIRAVAQGLEPDTKVGDVMSREVMYCFDDEDIEDVAQNMADIKVRRLPVLNRKKRLVGIVSLGDIAMADGPDAAGEAICGVSEPGGLHSQTADGRG